LKARILFLICTLYLISPSVKAQNRNNTFELVKLKYNKNELTSHKIENTGNKFRFKYFITTGKDKGALEKDFLSWSKGKKILTAFTGSYMSECTPYGARPLGFSMNDGNLINGILDEKLGAIVIIDAAGSLQIVNIGKADFTIKDQQLNYRKIDFKNALDRNYFIKWATIQKVSVFQTHLLVSEDLLLISPSGKTNKSERRFLMGGIDKKGSLHYYIFSLNDPVSLYEAAYSTFQTIQENQLIQSIKFIINLDMGCQNYYRIFNENGTVFNKNDINNQASLKDISNLIVLYEK